MSRGLTDEEAARQLDRDGPNQLPAPTEPSVGARALRHLLEPLSLVLVAAALASIFVLSHTVEGLTIAAIVVLNVTISTVQEQRASWAIAALEDLTAPTARAVRNGRSTLLPAAGLVRGDAVELAAGDRVPADVVLVDAASLAVDEALLTGEAFPVDKRVALPGAPGAGLADRAGEAFAGTLVVRGRGEGIVTRTGAFTELGAIASTLQVAADPPLVRDLRQVAARMSALAVVVGGALIPVVLLRSRSEPDAVVMAVLAGVALAVAAIPEGLGSIVITALALGARRMADGGAIVRRLEAIEALGSAQVICADKTGTVTTGRLTIADVVPVPGRELDLWRTAAYCNDASGAMGDPLDVALRDAAEAHGVTARVPAGSTSGPSTPTRPAWSPSISWTEPADCRSRGRPRWCSPAAGQDRPSTCSPRGPPIWRLWACASSPSRRRRAATRTPPRSTLSGSWPSTIRCARQPSTRSLAVGRQASGWSSSPGTMRRRPRPSPAAWASRVRSCRGATCLTSIPRRERIACGRPAWWPGSTRARSSISSKPIAPPVASWR